MADLPYLVSDTSSTHLAYNASGTVFTWSDKVWFLSVLSVCSTGSTLTSSASTLPAAIDAVFTSLEVFFRTTITSYKIVTTVYYLIPCLPATCNSPTGVDSSTFLDAWEHFSFSSLSVFSVDAYFSHSIQSTKGRPFSSDDKLGTVREDDFVRYTMVFSPSDRGQSSERIVPDLDY